MKKDKLGGGGRFKDKVSALKKEGYSEESSKAIAASIGRKKYGDKKMNEMAQKGRKKAMKKGHENDQIGKHFNK